MKKEEISNKQYVTKNMTIRQIIEIYPETIEVFLDLGIHCFECAHAEYETLESGLLAHGINVDDIVSELNNIIAQSNNLNFNNTVNMENNNVQSKKNILRVSDDCIMCGMCFNHYPQFFYQDESGKSKAKNIDISTLKENEKKELDNAINSCPVGAISIE